VKKLIATSILAALAACSAPTIADPRLEYPVPPAELMAPPRQMQEIPNKN